MKSRASTYGKGWSYFFRGLEGKEVALVQFIQDVTEYELDFITENPDAGAKLLADNSSKASLDYLKKNADKELLGLVTDSEAALGSDETLSLLLESTEMQPSGPGGMKNSLFQVSIDEINFDLSDRPGKIQSKKVPDLFNSLSDGVDLSEVDHVRTDFGEVYLGDVNKTDATMEVRNVHWTAMVDVEKFEDKIAEHLGVEKEAINV